MDIVAVDRTNALLQQTGGQIWNQAAGGAENGDIYLFQTVDFPDNRHIAQCSRGQAAADNPGKTHIAAGTKRLIHGAPNISETHDGGCNHLFELPSRVFDV